MLPPSAETEAAISRDPPRRRRWAPLILIAGAIGAAITFIPHLPRERRVELRLEDASTIVDLELTLARSSDGELVQGNAWHFPHGAPSSVAMTVNLTNDRYQLDVTIERAQGRSSIHRVISVDDSDQIAIPIR